MDEKPVNHSNSRQLTYRLVLFGAYCSLVLIGVLFYLLRPEPKEADQPVVAGWQPEAIANHEIAIIGLDETSARLAAHLEAKDPVRLCARQHQQPGLAPGCRCSPVLKVAGVMTGDDSDFWLAVHLPNEEREIAFTTYLANASPALVYGAVGDPSSDSVAARAHCLGGDKSAGTDISERLRIDVNFDKLGVSFEDGLSIAATNPQDSSTQIVIRQDSEGRFNLSDGILQLLTRAAESGIDVGADATRSLADIAAEAAGGFLDSLSRTAGEEIVKAMFRDRPRAAPEPRCTPCESGEEGSGSSKESTLLLRENLYFEVNQFELPRTTSADALLAGINRMLERHATCKLSVFGHTDTAGPRELNDRLASARARSVAAALPGNSAIGLWVGACSENSLQVPTADSVLERQNRRVEVNVNCADQSGLLDAGHEQYIETKKRACREIRGGG